MSKDDPDKPVTIKLDPGDIFELELTDPDGEVTVYHVAASAASTRPEALAIIKIGEEFKEKDDRTIYTWAHDDEPIVPRISEKGVAESTLKALAKFEYQTRETAKSHRRQVWMWLIGLVAAAAIAWAL